MRFEGLKRRSLYPVGLITVVVAISVGMLTGMDALTRDQIQAQKDAEINDMLVEMFPSMESYSHEDDIYVIYTAGEVYGYGFIAEGAGYGGTIEILVGLTNNGIIEGISIIAHEETPGLGDRITQAPFIDQFKGLKPEEVAFTADGGRVDSITSSTISAQAVVEAVRAEALEKIASLEGGER